ncbi:MAG: MBL fold metallo-hydrolase [Candidatus Aenigmarchaeota archaeon]|nr:MBL fold metallo-hydrolase [Candidatus Aenigmarchaeota archaeon]
MENIGNSAVHVDTGVEKFVMDYGTKVQEIPPKFPIPMKGNVDAVMLTHSHLDHSGGIPLLAANKNNPPIYGIEVAKHLCRLLWMDSLKIAREEKIELPYTKRDVKTSLKNFVPVKFRTPFKLRKTKVTYFDAGHIPGSAMIYSKFDDGKALLYTGDYNTIDTRLMKKADMNLPDVDYLITESTYSDREHPDRKEMEKELVKIVDETLANDGITLIAGFAVGRIDELLLVLKKHGVQCPIYVDGMAKKAITIINQYKSLLKEKDSLDNALENVEYVYGDVMRKRIVKKPGVILTTSGMLSGGAIIPYLRKLHSQEESSLILTSFQAEGTPGKNLLETGRFVYPKENIDVEVEMFVKRLEFSSHIAKKDLFDFAKKLNPEKIFCVHGDHTEEFAMELKHNGFDAIAPVANNRVFKL